MGAYADIGFEHVNILGVSAAATNYVVETPSGVLYIVNVDRNGLPFFKKSSDGGYTWSTHTTLQTGVACTQLSIWYDRWSNISAGLIHVAFTDSTLDDTFYVTINTESSDAISTVTTIFAGASTAANGHLSISRAVGGNVYCKTCIDAGVEGGFFRLPNANVPNGAWDAARTVDEALATADMMILLPDYDAADTQDMLAIFWDASADEISRKLYDDSGNSWSETSIATSMTDTFATTAWPNFSVAMDIANTRHILVAWSANDTANADLRCWTIDASSITETSANVVLNSTDDQGMCGVSLDLVTGQWDVVYAGKSDGSETFSTSLNIYTKGSKDSGATWGPETVRTVTARSGSWLSVCPRRYLNRMIIPFFWAQSTFNHMMINVPLKQPRMGAGIGA